MKKGIFIVLSLLVLGLVSGFAYVADSMKAEDSEYQIYQTIVVKNKYGEFKIPFSFAVVRRNGKIWKIVTPDNSLPSYISFKTIPSCVHFLVDENDRYNFWANLLFIYSLPTQSEKSEEIVYFVDIKGNKTKVSLLIQNEAHKNKSLEVWHVLLAKAYEENFPVIINARIRGLKHNKAHYILDIEICEVEIKN